MKSKYRKAVFSTVLLIVLAHNAGAQINESDTMKMALYISLTGSYQKGNVELTNLLGRGEFIVRPFPNWAFKTQMTSLYTKFSDKQIDNNIFSRNALFYKPERRVYGYVTAFISTNYRREIKFRYFISSGPAWRAIQSKAIVLKLAGNIVYESTLFSDTVFNHASYNGNERITLWRGSFYVGGWIYAFENRLRTSYEFYWQKAFNNGENYRTQLDIGISYPIWKGLGFNVVYIYSHENAVVEGNKKNDRILTFGLNYTLRKDNKKPK